MEPLLIVTQVDLTGAKQLASGVTAAMTEVQAAQARALTQLRGMSAESVQLAGEQQSAAAAVAAAQVSVGAAQAEAASAERAHASALEALQASEVDMGASAFDAAAAIYQENQALIVQAASARSLQEKEAALSAAQDALSRSASVAAESQASLLAVREGAIALFGSEAALEQALAAAKQQGAVADSVSAEAAATAAAGQSQLAEGLANTAEAAAAATEAVAGTAGTMATTTDITQTLQEQLRIAAEEYGRLQAQVKTAASELATANLEIGKSAEQGNAAAQAIIAEYAASLRNAEVAAGAMKTQVVELTAALKAQRVEAAGAERGLGALALQERLVGQSAAGLGVLAAQERAAGDAALFDAQAWQTAYTAKVNGIAATTELAAAAESEAAATETANAATQNGIGFRQQMTAALVLEGSSYGALRAIIQSFSGLGPVMQAVFPVITAIAFVEVLKQVPKYIDEAVNALVGFGAEAEKEYKKATGEAAAFLAEVERINQKETQAAAAGVGGTGKFAAQLAGLEQYDAQVTKTQGLIEKMNATLAERETKTAIPTSPPSYVRGVPIPQDVIAPKLATPEYQAKVKTQIDELNAFMQEEGKRLGLKLDLFKDINFAATNDKIREQLDELATDVEQESRKLSVAQNAFRSEASTKTEESLKAEAVSRARTADLSIEATRKATEAQIQLTEDRAKRALAAETITSAQEQAIIEESVGKRAAAEIRYEQSKAGVAERLAVEEERITLDSLKKQHDARALSDTAYQKEVAAAAQTRADAVKDIEIQSSGVIAAARAKGTNDAEKANAEAAKAALQVKLDAINEEIERIKSVPAANIAAEKEADRQILDLRRAMLEEIAAVAGGSGEGQQYKAELKLFGEQQQKLAEDGKKEDEELTKVRIDNLRRVMAEEERVATQRERNAVRDAQFEAKQAQDAIVLAKAREIKPSGGAIGAVFDIGRVQSDAAQQSAIVQAEMAKEKAASDALMQKQIADAHEVQRALDEAHAAGTILDKDYAEQSSKVETGITKDVQDNANRQAEIKRKQMEEEAKIEQQAALREIDAEKQISDSLARETDKMLFQSRNLHDAITKLWTDMARAIINQIIHMAAQWATSHLIMTAVNKIFHINKISDDERERTEDEIDAAHAAAVKTASIASQTAVIDAGLTEQTAATIVATKAQAAAYIPLAGAAGTASWAGAPWPIDLGAPAFGASMAAVTASFATAEEGWDLPSGGPFPMVGHSREMMLPEEHADTIRDMSDRRRYDQGGDRTENNVGAPMIGAVHYHAGPVHAFDSSGIDSVLDHHSGRFADTVTQAIKKGSIDPRQHWMKVSR